MKLYVWENVSCDWTCGMAVAVARSKAEAIDAVMKIYPYGREELETSKPTVVDVGKVKRPRAWHVSGGG